MRADELTTPPTRPLIDGPSRCGHRCSSAHARARRRDAPTPDKQVAAGANIRRLPRRLHAQGPGRATGRRRLWDAIPSEWTRHRSRPQVALRRPCRPCAGVDGRAAGRMDPSEYEISKDQSSPEESTDKIRVVRVRPESKRRVGGIAFS